MKKYPRVLLFGHSFNNYTGMGITLTNLFSGWPKDKIAVWANGIELELCESIRPCFMYIGKPKLHSENIVKNKQTFKDKVRNVLRGQYHKTGLQELRASSLLEPQYLADARKFAPDIIFCALGSDVAMKRCEILMNEMPYAKLVLYIVDDWVNTRINSRYFSAFWKRKYDRDFRHILGRASGLLSICQYMTDEYQKQYGRIFYPFHNPVNVKEWIALSALSKYSEDVISILYVGKINADTTPCLLDMCNVVEKLNARDQKYVFDIYSPDYSSKAYLFAEKENVHAFPPIAHERIPNVMKSYTSLFLPLGFTIRSRTYVRLSMPTKLTEYLASGKPMIVYCPEEIALAKYMYDKECAIMCTTTDVDELYNAVSKLQNKTLCNQLVDNALELAAKHDIDIIREQFREKLNDFLD